MRVKATIAHIKNAAMREQILQDLSIQFVSLTEPISLSTLASALDAEQTWYCLATLDGRDETTRRTVVMALLPVVLRAVAYSKDLPIHSCVQTIKKWLSRDANLDMVAAFVGAEQLVVIGVHPTNETLKQRLRREIGYIVVLTLHIVATGDFTTLPEIAQLAVNLVSHFDARGISAALLPSFHRSAENRRMAERNRQYDDLVHAFVPNRVLVTQGDMERNDDISGITNLFESQLCHNGTNGGTITPARYIRQDGVRRRGPVLTDENVAAYLAQGHTQREGEVVFRRSHQRLCQMAERHRRSHP